MPVFSRFRIAVLLFPLTMPIATFAQFPGDLQSGLEQRAASDPDLAQALQSLTAARDAKTYSEEEFRDAVRVEWLQYCLSPDDKVKFRSESRGSGTINAALGSVVSWVDKESGESVALNYQAFIQYLPEDGLCIDLTMEVDGQASTTTRHPFKDFAPVTVLLRDLPDGTQCLARFVPVIAPKRVAVEYGRNLRISLTSAVLLADDEFAGVFTVGGSIIGIASHKTGLMFEFALKPFADALPIGQTDGRTLSFDYDNHNYKLYSTEPITASAPEGTHWVVYVQASASDIRGYGTHSKSHDAILVQEAIESLAR